MCWVSHSSLSDGPLDGLVVGDASQPVWPPLPGREVADVLLAVTAAAPSSRDIALSHIEMAINSLFPSDREQALLFHHLRHGLGWTSDRAQTVLKKAGWWL